jgi:hypothetical protein
MTDKTPTPCPVCEREFSGLQAVKIHFGLRHPNDAFPWPRVQAVNKSQERIAELERSLAAAQARVQALSVGVGNIIWMTGGETSREQLQNIRNYATNLLDPPVTPQEGERDD